MVADRAGRVPPADPGMPGGGDAGIAPASARHPGTPDRATPADVQPAVGHLSGGRSGGRGRGDETRRPTQTDRTERFERMFYDHYPVVERYVARQFPDLDRADVLSLTFTTAWRRLDICPADAARGWLIGIARNTARNASRAARRRDAAETAAARRIHVTAELHDVCVEADVAARLGDAFAQLGDADRDVLELAVVHGLTGRDLAAALGVHASAANVRLHRARLRLAAAYAESEEAAS